MSDKTVSVNVNSCHTWIVSISGRGYKQQKHAVLQSANEHAAAAIITMATYIGRKRDWEMFRFLS